MYFTKHVEQKWRGQKGVEQKKKEEKILQSYALNDFTRNTRT